jgi:hypothetical protein
VAVEGFWRFLLRYFGATVGITAAIMGLAALGLHLAGARDMSSYGNTFGMLGFCAWVVGALSLFGRWGSTRSFSYQYGSSVSPAGIGERAKQLVRDTLEAYRFLIRCLLVGSILLGIGALLYFQ